MKPELLYPVLGAIVLLGFVAFLVRDRLKAMTLKWGDKSATINADRPGPGVKLSGVEAGHDLTAVDETGGGIDAKKVKSGGDAVFRNEAVKKKT
jgi:hypothetical protein